MLVTLRTSATLRISSSFIRNAVQHQLPPGIFVDGFEIRIPQQVIAITESAVNRLVQVAECRIRFIFERVQASKVIPGPGVLGIQLKDFPETGPGLFTFSHHCQGEAEVVPDIGIPGIGPSRLPQMS